MRDRVDLWKRIYDTDDNAITKALSRLAWDLTAFTCLVEMVRCAPENEDGDKRLNGMVLEMLGSGFWGSTLLGIRRLAERGSISGSRGVCSIGGLIQDAKAVRHRLTRRVFVEDIAGLEYDYAAVEARYWQFLQSQPSGQAVWVPREYHYEQSKRRHEVFDWLSGTTPDNRAPDDVIREDVFAALDRRLTRLDGVADHAHVEIAHAATEFSRTGRVLQQLSLNDVKAWIKELAQIAECVGAWFCFSGIGTMLPHPQFDAFAHLDEPLFVGDTQPLQEIWDALEQEIGEWHRVDPRTL